MPWQMNSTLILSCISSFFLVYPYFPLYSLSPLPSTLLIFPFPEAISLVFSLQAFYHVFPVSNYIQTDPTVSSAFCPVIVVFFQQPPVNKQILKIPTAIICFLFIILLLFLHTQHRFLQAGIDNTGSY